MIFESGNQALVELLRQAGISHYFGVTGGGVIHVAKHLEPWGALEEPAAEQPRLLTIHEYLAGFAPLGHYLATGRAAACLVTTGAATKLALCGLSDARFHNIPALYLIPLNSTHTSGKAPLQDMSAHGINIVPQLQAELGDGCIVVDAIEDLAVQLEKAFGLLRRSRPAAIVFHPDILCKPVNASLPTRRREETSPNSSEMKAFLNRFSKPSDRGRIIVYVGAEAALVPEIRQLTTALSERLNAPTVWSVNGANAISPANRFGYGYISFGGNDRALDLWEGLGPQDTVIALGMDPEEYVLNLQTLPVGELWLLTNLKDAYGTIDGSFRHRVAGQLRVLLGDIGHSLREILPQLPSRPEREGSQAAPRDLNRRQPRRQVGPGCVDLVAFYERVNALWQPHSVGFDDVCMAYKDRQYVCQRPNPSIRFFAATSGSAMGGAFGMGVGAKLADPHLRVFVFSGDGCFRLFGGALAEAANLGLRLFILDNSSYGIVEQGLRYILPEVEMSHYHVDLPQVDFVKAAEAHGWDAYRMAPDLSNLEEIMNLCNSGSRRSILVDLPVDKNQEIGLNPRVRNLTVECYL